MFDWVTEQCATELLSPGRSQAIRDLCNEAYGRSLDSLFDAYGPGMHLLGSIDGELVSHATWLPRTLYPGTELPLRAAYVEMVATRPAHQGRGLATRIMEALAESIGSFDVGALCPAETTLYARLGWQWWRGPLSVRKDADVIPTPEERLVILPLLHTPPLDLDQPLSVDWREREVW